MNGDNLVWMTISCYEWLLYGMNGENLVWMLIGLYDLR